jgi:hypothetical protein
MRQQLHPRPRPLLRPASIVLHGFCAGMIVSTIFASIGPADAQVSLPTSTLALVNKFRPTLASAAAKAQLVEADVPTVGCPQDGQVGPQDAPALPQAIRVIIPGGMSLPLTYYAAEEGMGVLAPKGWDCFGTYGSDGAILYVVPHKLGEPILDRLDKVKASPAVIRRFLIGGTSGRFPIAKISARIFPRARTFVDGVRAERIDTSRYVFTPWPADRLTRLSDFAVSYTTPANKDGLGTALGLARGRDPVSGLVFLSDIEGQDDGPFLDGISVRLERSDQALYPAIAVAGIVAQGAKQANSH